MRELRETIVMRLRLKFDGICVVSKIFSLSQTSSVISVAQWFVEAKVGI